MSATIPTALNHCFLENMRQLWRRDPPLALDLDRIDDDALPEPEPSRSGPPTLRCAGQEGELYLHSRYDPVAEARRWAAGHLESNKFCYLVEGVGLGYHVQQLLAELPAESAVVGIEPDPGMLRLALSHLDFSIPIREQRLAFLCRDTKDAVHRVLGRYRTYLMMGTRVATHAPSVQLAPEFFSSMRQLCRQFIDYARTGMVTLVTNAQTTCRNVAGNLATYLATPPINELRSRFASHPAVVVSAGPSLHKNVALLAEARGRAVIIATQTTFKNLLQRDIIPDYVCSLDYHELSRQNFENLDDLHDVHLIAEPKAHPSVIDTFSGPVSLLNNEFAQLCLGGVHGRRDGLAAGASVAHLAFYLAEYLGCDPIILVGQDLALTDHVYYAPGAPIHAVWQAELNRFCTMEMKEWERIMRRKPILRRVPDGNGRPLYTEELMFNYLEQFEKDFARTHARVIDATEGGARKLGTEVMTLRQAIDRFCTRQIDPQRYEYRRRRPWIDPSRLPAGREQLGLRLTDMIDIRELCDQTLQMLEELTHLVDRPAQFNDKIKQVDRLRLRVRELEVAYRIIVSGAQLAEFRKFSADVRLRASGAVGAERAVRQLERDISFVRGLRQDAEIMIGMMEEAIRRFEMKMEQFGKPA